MAGTQSAMLDGRRIKKPNRFDPTRPAHDYMVFGYGLHWCVGAFIAEAHATQTLKALLLQPSLTRVRGKRGELDAIGVLPLHLEVQL
jgi:cytochrome P450